VKIFDAHIYADERPDNDFSNLAWFDVERVLLCAHAPKTFQTAFDLVAYWQHLLDVETVRIERLGLQTHVAIGIHPSGIPRRAHYEIWRELPQILHDPRVSALGEIGVLEDSDKQWAVVDRQLRALASTGLNKPVVFRPPRTADTRDKIRAIQKFADLVATHGITSDNVVVQHVDWLTIDAVEAAGFYAGLTTGPFFLTAEQAVPIVEHHNRHRIVAASALRTGGADVVAIPKLAVALGEAGIPRGDIERIVYGNAMSLFVR
jgi:predicted metal-dependent TIM-barrel fold hydrolase